MSYILEAIRRSEEERRKRLIPGVATIQAATARAPSPARPVWPALAAALALAALAALAVAMWPWIEPVREPAARSAPAAGPAEAENDGRVADNGHVVAKPDVDGAGDRAVMAPTPAPTPARPDPAPDAKPAVGEPEPHVPPRRTDIDSGRETGAPRSRRAAPAAPAAIAPEPAPEPPEVLTAMALRDLPAPMQRALPDLAITLHRYAEKPLARTIRVNGRMAREGDMVSDDLRVAQITRDGVVFEIGGRRFYMDAFQSWRAKGGS